MILMNIHTRGYMMSEWKTGHIEPFWDEQYKDLKYTKVVHNNSDYLKRWRKEGYTHSDELFTGDNGASYSCCITGVLGSI